MAKIQMKTPLVEMDGDEMTRIIWQWIRERLILPYLDIELRYYDLSVEERDRTGDEMTRVLWRWVKDKLIAPYVDLKTEYFDLGLAHRDQTDDKVTMDAAEATKKLGVAVKCATITPNADRVVEYKLKKQWKSPNGTIRAALDGTVFRKPIMVRNVKPAVASWKKPIIVGRHAYGDVYKNAEIAVPGPGKGELVFTGADGKETRVLIQEFKGPGVLQGIHNTEKSIRSFARSCFNYALDEKVDVWFATKDTISKTYDQTFKPLFKDVFEKEYKDRFAAAGGPGFVFRELMDAGLMHDDLQTIAEGGMRAYDVSSPGDLRVGDRVRLVNGQISRY